MHIVIRRPQGAEGRHAVFVGHIGGHQLSAAHADGVALHAGKQLLALVVQAVVVGVQEAGQLNDAVRHQADVALVEHLPGLQVKGAGIGALAGVGKVGAIRAARLGILGEHGALGGRDAHLVGAGLHLADVEQAGFIGDIFIGQAVDGADQLDQHPRLAGLVLLHDAVAVRVIPRLAGHRRHADGAHAHGFGRVGGKRHLGHLLHQGSVRQGHAGMLLAAGAGFAKAIAGHQLNPNRIHALRHARQHRHAIAVRLGGSNGLARPVQHGNGRALKAGVIVCALAVVVLVMVHADPKLRRAAGGQADVPGLLILAQAHLLRHGDHALLRLYLQHIVAAIQPVKAPRAGFVAHGAGDFLPRRRPQGHLRAAKGHAVAPHGRAGQAAVRHPAQGRHIGGFAAVNHHVNPGRHAAIFLRQLPAVALIAPLRQRCRQAVHAGAQAVRPVRALCQQGVRCVLLSSDGQKRAVCHALHHAC